MARACSGANTVHYAHVMNWPLYVKGLRAVDLMKDGIGPAALSTLLKEARKQIKRANDANFPNLFIYPPVDDPCTILDWALCFKWHAKFAEAFFAPAKLESLQQQVREFIIEPRWWSLVVGCNR